MMMRYLRRFVISLVASLLMGGVCIAASPDYVRPKVQSDRVIVFVHGIFGDSLGTWRNAKGQYLWDFVANEPAIKTANIYAYGFPSKFQAGSFGIDEAVDDLEQRLRIAGVFQHKQIIFVAHSMGGLVVEAFLLRFRHLAPQTPVILLYSTPHEGSEISSIARVISSNPGLETMISGDKNQYLRRLESDWRNSGFTTQVRCAYELLDTYKIRIVTRLSATRPCSGSSTPVNADHIDMVKPLTADSGAVLALKLAIISLPGIPGSTVAPPSQAVVTNTPTPAPTVDFRPGARKSVRDYLSSLKAEPQYQEAYSSQCRRYETETLDVSSGMVTVRNFEYTSENCPAQATRIVERTCVADLGNIDGQIIFLGNPKMEIQCLSGDCFDCEVMQRLRAPPSLDFGDQVRLPSEKQKSATVYIGRELPIRERISRFSPFARSLSRLLSNGDDSIFCNRHSIYCQ